MQNPPTHPVLEYLSSHPEFEEIEGLPHVKVDLKYATTDNFMGKNVYGSFNRAFLHREASRKLKEASGFLQTRAPGFSLHIYDALRPRSVQHILWKHVCGTSNERYVANPNRGSMHNYGCAVDLTLANDQGEILDMGSGFDEFSEISQPRLEEHFVNSGKLTELHIKNRSLLREIMQDAGFIQLPHEWWHYDAFSQTEIRSRFTIVE